MSDLEPSFPERMVNRLATSMDRNKAGRRGFLAGLAVSGSALALKPWSFLVRDAAAYDVVCGNENECADGWTAFCCTVAGSNSCPPGSFAAGWWKADNSGFCCGKARYYIDCNASCGSDWQCHCASGTCDRRRVACNQFRYGQCHQEIACYGPVVCRVVTCQPPWQWDQSCTTTSLTDNRTASHSAPCLTPDCLSDVDRLWHNLGGPSGSLGNKTGPERRITPRGYRTLFQRGAIYRYDDRLVEVHGSIWDLFQISGLQVGALHYPIQNTRTGNDGVTRYSLFQTGGIYFRPGIGTFEVHGSIWDKWRHMGDERSSLRLPKSSTRTAPDGSTRYSLFDHGGIYARPRVGTFEVHGAIFTKWNDLGGFASLLRYPRGDTRTGTDGSTRYAHFDAGAIFYRPQLGTFEIHGPIYDKWKAIGGGRSSVRYPIADTQVASDGQCQFSLFDIGGIYFRPGLGTFEVHGAIFDTWTSNGGPNGALGLPTADTTTAINGDRVSTFDHGAIRYSPLTGATTIETT